MIDWLAAGGQLDELVRLANNAPDWIPPIGDKLIHSSREFVAGFVPPDYLIDGLIQRRYFYSMTAPTGAGKTCVAIRIAAHAALGLSLDGRNVEKVRVLFLAGENPDDVRARWIKLCEEMQTVLGRSHPAAYFSALAGRVSHLFGNHWLRLMFALPEGTSQTSGPRVP